MYKHANLSTLLIGNFACSNHFITIGYTRITAAIYISVQIIYIFIIFTNIVTRRARTFLVRHLGANLIVVNIRTNDKITLSFTFRVVT